MTAHLILGRNMNMYEQQLGYEKNLPTTSYEGTINGKYFFRMAFTREDNMLSGTLINTYKKENEIFGTIDHLSLQNMRMDRKPVFWKEESCKVVELGVPGPHLMVKSGSPFFWLRQQADSLDQPLSWWGDRLEYGYNNQNNSRCTSRFSKRFLPSFERNACHLANSPKFK